MIDPTGMAPDSYASMQNNNVGADGLTNEQWVKSSNPLASSGLANQYRRENRNAEVGVNRALSQHWNSHAGEETSREYDEENRTVHIRYSGAYRITGGGSYGRKAGNATPPMSLGTPLDWIQVSWFGQTTGTAADMMLKLPIPTAGGGAIGMAKSGREISKLGWIVKETFSDLTHQQKGVFVKAMQKGIVRGANESGIKYLGGKGKIVDGIKYFYEIKTPINSFLGSQRIYGNKDIWKKTGETKIFFSKFKDNH